MKTFVCLLVLFGSVAVFAASPSVENARECIMDFAGNHPELRSCRGKALRSDPADGEDIEKCDASGDIGKCFIYIQCPLGDGTSQRYKVEADINYRDWAVVNLLKCQMSNVSVTALGQPK